MNSFIEAYRQFLAQTGQKEKRTDRQITEEVGNWANQEDPSLFDEYPDFAQQWGEIREANAPSLGAEFGRAAKRATIGLGATALGGGALITGSDYLKRKSRELDLMASDPDLAPTIPTLEAIRPGQDGIGQAFSRDALRYGISKVGEVVPSAAEAAVTAGIGALAGSAAAPGPGTVAGAAGGLLGRGLVKRAIRKLVTKELTEEAIEKGLREGAEQIVEAVTRNAADLAKVGGATAASAVNSYILNAGEVYNENDDRGTAAVLGLVSAIPDTVLPALVVRKLFPGVSLSAGRQAAKELVGENAVRVAKAAGVTGFEAGTEAFQESVNIVARNLKEGRDPLSMDDADLVRIREAGITGAFGGALASPAVVLGGEPETVEQVSPGPAISQPAQSSPAATPVAPPAPVMQSPVRRVRAMSPEQQVARLAELETRARVADEEAEYQILLATVPREAQTPITPEVVEAVQAGNLPLAPAPAEAQTSPQTVLQEPAGVAGSAPNLGSGVETVSAPASTTLPAPEQPVVAAGRPPVTTDPVQIETDRVAYGQLQDQMRQMIRDGQTGTDDFNAVWQASEVIKNRHGGMPPGVAAAAPALTPAAVQAAPLSTPVTNALPITPASEISFRNQPQDGSPMGQGNAVVQEAAGAGSPAQAEAQVTPETLPDAKTASETVWYHGTGATIPDASRVTSTWTKINSLFGTGFYLTDNKEIADSYGKKRGGKGGRTYAVKVSPRAVLNLELPMTEQVAEILEGSVYDDFKDVVSDGLDAGKTTAQVISDLRDAVADQSQGDMVPESEYHQMFQEIEGNFRTAGIDAFTHVGGTRAGRGKKLHRVLIMLDPSGEFSASNAPTPKTVVDLRPGDDPVQPTVQAAPRSAEQRLNDAGIDLPPISSMSREAKRAELDAAGITEYNGKPLDEANPAQISAAVGKLRRGELGRDEPPAPRISTDPTNPAVNAQRTKEFQAVMGRLVENGANVQLFSRELLAQQTGEVLQQQIAALEARLQQATTAPQRNALTKQIALRQERLSEVQQMRGVTYNPYHIAIAMDDVMNASLDNLVTLLHEAAESLTMRLTPAQQGAVFRAVEKATAQMQARMQDAAKNTGATIADVPVPSELLAETMAQTLAAEGIADAPSLADAIVRWIKEIYYRVAMAAQRAFGGEPSPELALQWYENQLRREVGGDYEYAFGRLLDRFLPQPNRYFAQKFSGATGTPGGLVDYFDPASQKLRQPRVDPTSDEALAWNMKFQTVGATENITDGIPAEESNDRITAAAYNEVISWMETQRAELAPQLSIEQFAKRYGVGSKSQVEMLATLETRRPGVSGAKIGGERMTDDMSKLAANMALAHIRALSESQSNEYANIQSDIKKNDEEYVKRAREVNRIESDVRNKELHEGELKAKAKKLIEGVLASYKTGLRTSSKLGMMVESEEGLGPRDPLPQFYSQAYQNLLAADLPLFDYAMAIAGLDLNLADMTPEQIWKAIRDNADTSAKLRELTRNKPLALTMAVLARENAREIDQIMLRTAPDKLFLDIKAELDGIRNATEAQLREMIKALDEKVEARGLLQRIRKEYLKARRRLNATSDMIAQSEERADMLMKLRPSLAAKEEEMEQASGGIYSDWSPGEGKELIVMRQNEAGEWQRSTRKLSWDSDGTAVDWKGLVADLISNNIWIQQNESARGTKRFNEIEHQTRKTQMLDLRRKYAAANYDALNLGFLRFGDLLKRVDSLVRPISAIAKQAGHSSSARVNMRFNQFDFITKMADPMDVLARKWTSEFQSLQKTVGIEDNGQFLSKLYNPVMYFLGVNPGLDESQALREAARYLKDMLPGEQKPDFREKLDRFLRATKEVNGALLKVAEDYGLFVMDPKLGGELRRALARGWLTGMRSMNGATVRTLITDMQKAGWKIGSKDEPSTFDSILPPSFSEQEVDGDLTDNSEERAEYFSQLDNTDVLRAGLAQYFTPDIMARWLIPFIKKPGESVFHYDGQPISQLDLQNAWLMADGDVLNWIDNLGAMLELKTEDGASPVAAFRADMLGQIDRLFAWEATMAHSVDQAPDLTDPQGDRPHLFMDARVNDLLPPEHVKFASFDPTSTRQMLTQIAYHAAFGRNGQALVADLRELESVVKQKYDAYVGLKSTSTEGRKREAKALGYDYEEIKAAAGRYNEVRELVAKIKAATGTTNTYGMLHDAKVPLELLGFIVGQAVDRPPTAALNLLSLGQRPFAQHSMGKRVLSETIKSYGEFMKSGFGGFMRSFGSNLVAESEYEAEVGQLYGMAMRDQNWGVALSDIGKEGRFQESKLDEFLIRPLRALRAAQKKGVGVGPFVAPGLGVMGRIQSYAAVAGTVRTIKQLERAINRGIQHYASHPNDLSNPAFRFDHKNLNMNKGEYEWFRNKTVEYGMGNLEDIVRGAIPAQARASRLLTKDQVLRLAQMTSQEFDGASSINTTPSWMATNPAASFFIPLLRWPLWMMHAAHNGMADQQQRTDFKSMAKALGIMAAWNLPLGLAFTFMLDEYDEKVLGKKNALPNLSKVAALPVVGAALALATGDEPFPQELMAMGQRLMRANNTYGLGADMLGQFVVPFDPASGQRVFSLDQRILVMSQFLNLNQALRNFVAQGNEATWGSVWRPLVNGIGGNGVLHSLDVVNNVLDLDNAEARNVMRTNAARWVNAAAREVGIPTKGITSSGTPTPMSVWTREMQLAAMANSRADFMEAYRKALQAAREKVGEDDRIQPENREKEAVARVLASWRARNPFSGLATTATPDQIQAMLRVMNDQGRRDVQDAMRYYDAYTALIKPSEMEQMLNRRMQAANPMRQMESLRRRAAGMMMAE